MSFRDEVQAVAQGRRSPSPYDERHGIRILALGDGTADLAVDVDERFHNPAHVLHGGVLCGLVDSAMAYAASTRLGPEESVTNIDLTVRFLQATTRARLTAQARVLRAGRTVLSVQADVLDEQGEIVATASSSFIRRKAREGAGWLRPTKPTED